MVFEGFLHEALANSLGRILDISREQLRISLWSAWRTGLTLENVGLRTDAFEHLQLPITLRSGRIGRIQAQVPWTALRSPVVVELSDVHLCIALRRDEELSEGPAAERSWLAKQAEIAATELGALAAASGGDAGGGGGGRAGGVLWSFVQHVLAMLVNRLQLSVSSVHIEFEDPQTGTRLGLQLARLHTCRPGDASPTSLLLSDDGGLRAHASAAARGSLQKQFAVEGLALYWEPAPWPPGASSSSSDGKDAAADQAAASMPSPRSPAKSPAKPGCQASQQVQQPPRPPPSYVLHPTDFAVHCTLQLSGGATSADGSGSSLRVHAAAVLHHLQLSLDASQAADMVALADRLAWCAARNKHAAYCPDGWRLPGPRTVPWRRVWRYAVNAVLQELRGERQGRVPWRDGPARVALRKQYIAAYRDYLERKHLLEGGPAAAAAARRRALAEADEQLPALERELSVSDILTCRRTAQRVLQACLAAASGMGEALEDGGAAAAAARRKRSRCAAQLPPSVVGGQGGHSGTALGSAPGAGAGSLATGPVAAAPSAAPPPRPASLGASSSAASSSLAEGPAGTAGSGGRQRRRGYLAWGLSKAASVLRYMPYSGASEASGGAGALPEPTEAELEELYRSVDFHPEEQQAAAAAAPRAGAAGLHLTLDCLVSGASLLLLEAPSAAERHGGPQWHPKRQGTAAPPLPQLLQQQSNGGGSSSSSRDSGLDSGKPAHDGGRGIATVELDRLKLSAVMQPEKTTATLTLADVTLHDLCSEPGLSSPILHRGGADGTAAAAAAGYLAPVLKLHFVAAAAGGSAGHADGSEPGPAAPGGPEPRAQLDALVQPLLLRLRPLCIQRIVACVPAVAQGSFQGARLAALNALGAEARCAIKARHVAALGPPVNLLVKVVDLDVRLGCSDCDTSPGIILRTGPVMLVSSEPQQQGPGPAQRRAKGTPGRSSPPRPPQHVLSAAEAAAHLSAVIRQRSIAARLGVVGAAGKGGRGDSAAASGSSLDAAAAVAAVQQHLLYAQFELSVAELQVTAVNLPPLPAQGSEAAAGRGTASPTGAAGSAAGGSPFDRQLHTVLQPMRLGGTLKMHRISEDYSLPQVQLGLQADPISLSLTQHIVTMLASTFLPRPAAEDQTAPAAGDAGAAGTDAAPTAALPRPAHASQAAPGAASLPSPFASSMAGSPSNSPGSAAAAPAGGAASAAPVVSLDLQLARLDVRFSADPQAGMGPSGTGSISARSSASAAALAVFEACVSCSGSSLSVQSMLDGMAVQASMSRLLLHDLSPAAAQPGHLPPPVRAEPVPRIARKLSIDRLAVGHRQAGAGPSMHSTTRLELWDLSVEGFAGEAGSFLSRLHERQLTHVNVFIEDSPAATRTAMAASNLLIGHGLLLRLAALAEALTEQQRQAAALAAAAAGGAQASRFAGRLGSRELLDSDLPPHADPWAPAAQQQQQQGEQQEAAPMGGSEQPAAADGTAEPLSAFQQQRTSPADASQQPVPPAEEKVQPSSAAASAVLQPPSADAVGQQQPGLSTGEEEGEPLGAASRPSSPGSSTPQQAQQAQQLPSSPPTAAAVRLQLTPQQQAVPLQAAQQPASPAKPVLTSIQLSDCRLVLRYQAGMHPSAAAGDGSGHGGASSGLPAGAGIPAATHDFLSVHSDLMAVDVPLLRLQLPLDPGGLAAMAEAEAAGRSAASGQGGATPAAPSPASSPGGASPPGGSSSGSWQEPSLATASPAPGQLAALLDSAEQAQQVLAEARRLSVFVAAVGQPRHVMLPLLQLPSLRLACATRPVASTGGAARGLSGTSSRASSAGLTGRGWAASSAACEAAYSLEVSCVDLGLHPSQLSMLTSAAQLCQYELMVLRREPAGSGSAGRDAESVITVTSAGAFELQRQAAAAAATEAARVAAAPQQAQQQQAAGHPGALAAGDGAPAAGHSFQGSPAATPQGGPTPRPSGETAPAVAAVAAAAAAEHGSPSPQAQPQWRLEASIDCLGVSLLGATPSSSCLKLEWRDLQASVVACSQPLGLEGMTVGGSSPLQPQSGSAHSGASSPAGAGGGTWAPGTAAAAWAQLSLQLSWRQLSLHVLHPRLSYTHPALTPFAFAAALAGEERVRGSQRILGGSSPPGGSPRPSLGPLPEVGEVSFRLVRGPGSTGVRRNLSAGLSLADVGTEEFHDASAVWLSRPSQGSSGGTRYFSLAESEFEDAASELPEGAQSPPGGHGPPEAPPLPLQLGGSGHDSQLLLVLHAQAAPVVAAAAEQPVASSPVSVSIGSAGRCDALPAAGSDAERLDGAARPHAADSRAVVSVQLGMGGHQVAAAASCLSLRAHTAGWEEAAQCLHTYHVLAQQAQRQYAAAEEAWAAGQQAAPRAAPPAAPRSAAAEPPWFRQAQQQPGGSSLRLALEAVQLQLVADGDLPARDGKELDGNGEALPARIPVAALQARLQVEAEQRPDGSSRVRLSVPGLLLAVGTVPEDVVAATGTEGGGGAAPGGQPAAAALVLPLQDSLLGIRDAELTVASQDQRLQLQPAATSAEGSILLAPARQVSVGASLVQVSVWAHPHNLCAATALAGHARALAAELAARLPMGGLQGGGGDRASGGLAGAAAPPPRQLTVKLNVGKAAALLSLLSRGDRGQRLLSEPAPLLELAVAALTADLCDMAAGCIEGSLKGELQVAVFSGVKLGWEPLLEPWQFRLAFAVPTTVPPSQHRRLSISSTQGLELTVTQAAVEAAALAGGALAAASGLLEDPSALEARLEAAGGSAAYSAAYWLVNQTGSTLELWLAAPEDGQEAGEEAGDSAGTRGEQAGASSGGDASGGDSAASSPRSGGTPFASAAPSAAGSTRGVGGHRLLSGPPELVVQPGARAVLPVVASSAEKQQGLHVGFPCPLQGVTEAAHGSELQHEQPGRSGAGDGSGAAPSRHGSFLIPQLGSEAAAPRTRTLLFFRLAEQTEISGPLLLDRGCFRGCTSCPGVLCDMDEARHGGYTLVLHSGVQLRNTTQLALDIGVQTPMGLVMEPQALGTLGPGDMMWLPALRAHSGLLCVRPALAGPAVMATAAGGVHGPASPLAHAPSAPALPGAAAWQPGPGPSRIPSLAANSLAAAAALVAGPQAAAAAATGAPAPPMAPTSPLLYSTSGLASPGRTSSDYLDLASRGGHAAHGAAGAAAPGSAASWHHPYEWSAAVPLQALLRQAAGSDGLGSGGRGGGAERNRGARPLACAAGAEGQPPVLLCMGAVRVGSVAGRENAGAPAAVPRNGSSSAGGAPGLASSWEVLLSAPLTLHNALPVPAEVSLSAWGRPHRLLLQPNQYATLHAVDAAHVEHVMLRALGYHPTRPLVPPALPPVADAGGAQQRHLQAQDLEVALQSVGHSQAEVQVFVRHSLDTATGSHTLLFGCALWVFNCTGLPVALRERGPEGPLFGEGGDSSYQRLMEEELPESWLPPLDLPGQPQGSLHRSVSQVQHSPLQARVAPPAGLRAVSREGGHGGHGMQSVLSTPTSAAASVTNVSRGASTVDMAGLSEILESGGTPKPSDSRQVLGLKRTVSRARGIADSMEATPAFEMPSRWPSLQGGLHPHRQRLRLQIRATQCQAPPGRTYWSAPLELDALGGAAVVSVPAPLLPPTAAIPASRAAYPLSVTASQVPGSGGALALYLLPRYLLINTLDVPIQYKQQGTQHERELAAGASRALRWADLLRPLRLSVRVQEAGWMWSGGFELDSPGDMFIKIRHRDRGVTMLVRVDVATSAASGVLRITLSHHPAGFAPYRIDNCSLETLHARQHKVREQQDVLRPYCSLHYAWDEPAQPHRLVLELPGARQLGVFDLDKVGQDRLLSIPGRGGEPTRQVRVRVSTEGPTRVLSVLDVQRHLLLEELGTGTSPRAAPRGLSRFLAGAAATSTGASSTGGTAGGLSGRQQRPWDSWSLPALPASQQQARRNAKLSGLLWEVGADLAWLGVSVVGAAQEVAYLRASGLRADARGTAAHLMLDLELRQLQLDNPSPWVALPVTLVVPAPISRLTSTVAAAVELQRRPAVVARLELWQRRPAGVLCVEEAELQLAPLAVFVDQRHALHLAEFLGHLGASFAAAEAAAAAAAPSPRGGRGSGTVAGTPAAGEADGSSRAGSEASLQAAAAGSSVSAVVGAPGGGGSVAAALAAPLRLPGLPPEVEALLSGGQGGAGLAPAEQKVYIDVLRIATLELTISFLPAPFENDPAHPRLQALQRMLSLADIEDARLRLAALELRNPLMGASALAQLLQRHYTRALLPELYKLVGSASVFGDPVRLFHHLGLGVWSFLASPAAGLVESARQRGPRQFLRGFASGTQSLFQNVVFALSNAAAKGSTAARKAITALGLDRLPVAPDARRRGPRSSFQLRLQRWDTEQGLAADSRGSAVRGSAGIGGGRPGSAGGSAAGGAAAAAVMFSPREGLEGPQGGSGDGGVLGAVLLGVVGLASEPIRGLDEGGLLGLLAGIKRGAIGVVVLPLASLLEMFAGASDSIRRAVAGSSNVGWVRPPRFVTPAHPLAPYSWSEAMGRWLLTELERASAARPSQRAQRHAAGAANAVAPGGLAATLQRQAEPPSRFGAFVLCVPLAEAGCFLVVSSQRALHICTRAPMWRPLVRWSARIADLELVAQRGPQISLVAQQPLRRHIVRSSSALPRSLADVLKAPRPPFSFLTVECESARAAHQLRAELLQRRQRVPPLATYIGHCSVLLPPAE